MSKNGLVSALFFDAAKSFKERAAAKSGDLARVKRAKVLLPELAGKVTVLNKRLADLAETRHMSDPSRRSGTAINDDSLAREFRAAQSDFDQCVQERASVRERIRGLSLIVELCDAASSPMWGSHAERMKKLAGVK